MVAYLTNMRFSYIQTCVFDYDIQYMISYSQFCFDTDPINGADYNKIDILIKSYSLTVAV